MNFGYTSEYFEGERLASEEWSRNGHVVRRLTFHENGRLKSEERFANGEVVCGAYYDEGGNLLPTGADVQQLTPTARSQPTSTSATVDLPMNLIGVEPTSPDNPEIAGQEAIDKAIFDQKYKDPREFVKLNFHDGIPYKTVRRLLGEEDLPLLHEMLRDPAYFDHWSAIAKVIGFLSNSPASVSAIEEYVIRQEDWSEIPAQHQGVRAVYKAQALLWVGLIGGDQAGELLRQAITEQGARDLAENWLDEAAKAWPTEGEDKFIGLIRGCSATSLVHLGEESDVNMVADLYEAEHARCKAARQSTEFYYNLVGAMATRDLIEEIGKEAYLNGQGTRTLSDAKVPFIEKYAWWRQGAASPAPQ